VLDICDLILEDHEALRHQFAELDELRSAEVETESAELARIWANVADLLEVHAASEEELFYPRLLEEGDHGKEETEDAINDHNEIRDAVRRAGDADAGSEEWWEAVLSVRATNSDHMAEEERGAIADFRVNGSAKERQELATHWVGFRSGHRRREDVDGRDKDAGSYIASNS
jgi:hypothetical protein